ncbi:unnamed protein product, partial [Iphiclides podalirius]
MNMADDNTTQDDYKAQATIKKSISSEKLDHKIDVVKNVEKDVEAVGCAEKVFPSTSNADDKASISSLNCFCSDSEDDDDDDESYDDDYVETTVNVDLSNSLLGQLDELYGRKSMEYPPNISHMINLPVYLLNKINTLWIESVMDQFDRLSSQTEFKPEQDEECMVKQDEDLMVKQDEEVTTQLPTKESELAQADKEADVPALIEIMDKELALSLYQEDVAEWGNKDPNDLAVKLKREKLFNAFPDISSDVLSELLIAHDNNYNETVEGLLESTGKSK